ncbi:hypothetical protein FC56_GL000759 [Lentilactobacillus senioris DSM 24302 = JCM 17472]|uniref:DUF4828 domain-containing protein n=1 Tax=Lentilactobacillus senioris DSM 24302 = JCM 17472 TaxID=1423802 RepID=A0A0R2CNM4_9LACO|nr:DUF4828 domain-containing protein [Lentilactobacillus senioris]KRM93095.1 hypothetical protein FC56_GL000759 [Lentilactobacillus senioris DSM 24302 = JCM 17472]
MRRRTVILFVASLVAGLLKTPKKHKELPNGKTDPRFFVGSWQYTDQENRLHHLTINPDLELIIDQKPVKGNVETINAYQLIFLDALGYHLIIKANEIGPVEFFDEADNVNYSLNKAN